MGKKTLLYSVITSSMLLLAACAGDDEKAPFNKVADQQGKTTAAALDTNLKKVSDQLKAAGRNESFTRDKDINEMINVMDSVFENQLKDNESDRKASDTLARTIDQISFAPDGDHLNMQIFSKKYENGEEPWLIISGSNINKSSEDLQVVAVSDQERGKTAMEAGAEDSAVESQEENKDKNKEKKDKDKKKTVTTAQKKPMKAKFQCLDLANNDQLCEIMAVYLIDENQFSFTPLLYVNAEAMEGEKIGVLDLALEDAKKSDDSLKASDFEALFANIKKVQSRMVVPLLLDQVAGYVGMTFDDDKVESLKSQVTPLQGLDTRKSEILETK